MKLTAEQFKEFKGLLEDTMSKYATDEEVTGLSKKLEELEQKFVEMLPSSRDTGRIPITKGSHGVGKEIYWSSKDEAEGFMALMQGIFKNDQEMLKDNTVGVDTEGGYLAAPDFRAVLIRLIENFGVVRRMSTIIPMRGNTLEMPRLSENVMVYWPDEGKPITESEAVFGNITIAAKKLAALVPVTSELFEDSSIAIANLYATLFAEAFAKEEDRVFLTGDAAGGDPFDGVLNTEETTTFSLASGNTSIGDLTAKDLLDMTDQVSMAALDGAWYTLHRSVLNHIRSLTATDGQFIWQRPTEAAPGTIWGYPYQLTDQMPKFVSSATPATKYITFGNWRHFYMGNRRGLSVASSQHIGFKSDRIYLRALQRVGGVFAIPEAFCNLATAAS